MSDTNPFLARISNRLIPCQQPFHLYGGMGDIGEFTTPSPTVMNPLREAKMRWSPKLGTFAAVAVYMHWTFWVLLVCPVLAALGSRHDLDWVARNVLLVLALLSCVLLHELGHVLVARRFGIPTLNVTIFPFGGVARLVRKADTPVQEFLIAAAGPAVNLAIAFGLHTLLVVSGHPLPAGSESSLGGFLATLMWVNVALALLNVIPAPPLDGARILSSVVAVGTGGTRALRNAATPGA